jgi:small-conductance mechanosensitive channel
MNENANKTLESIVGFFRQLLDPGPELLGKLILSAATILVIVLIRWAVMIVVAKRSEDVKVRYRWRKISSYTANILLLFLVGRIWFQGVASLSTFLGLLSAGIAIALKDLLVNFAGWVFILWRKPFEVGDRIQLGQYAGDVIDIRIFQFTLLEIGNWVDAEQSTGRIIHVPNGWVFNQVQANYSKGFQYIWDEIPVLITFESNWEKAEQILNKIVNDHAEKYTDPARQGIKRASRRYMIHYGTMTPKVYVTVKDSGVMLTLRYLCQPRARRTTQEIIWKEILRAFAARDDIDFAYPTQRIYYNAAEGKPGTKPGSVDSPDVVVESVEKPVS